MGKKSRYYVYTITHLPTEQVYVGLTSSTRLVFERCANDKSVFLPLRMNEHLDALLNNRHYNTNLQALWDKSSPAAFEFRVIDALPSWYKKTDALAREREYIAFYPKTLNVKPGEFKLLYKYKKLPEALILEIEKQLKTTEKHGAEIAKELGVSTATVSLISSGKHPASSGVKRIAQHYKAAWKRDPVVREQYDRALANPVLHLRNWGPQIKGTINWHATCKKYGVHERPKALEAYYAHLKSLRN